VWEKEEAEKLAMYVMQRIRVALLRHEGDPQTCSGARHLLHVQIGLLFKTRLLRSSAGGVASKRAPGVCRSVSDVDSAVVCSGFECRVCLRVKSTLLDGNESSRSRVCLTSKV